MDKPELTSLLVKITYRAPFEEWGLTENDFDVINQATPAEIADISYQNGLQIKTLIENSDRLVDLYNERLQKKMVRDLKNLKLDLYSDLPRVKKVKPPPAETDEIERRLLDEVINDVIEGPFDLTNDDEDSDTNINIEEEMIRRGLLKPSGFGPMIERENLSRESESILEQLMRITIPERVQSIQINDIGEGFGEADHEEIAAAGVFDMSNGRQIYDSLNNRQTGAEIAQLVEQRRAAQVTDEVQGLSAQEALEPAEPAVSEIEIDLPATSHVEPVETEIPELPVRLESISLDDTPVRVSLRENIERILIENEIQKVKKRRKPRRKRRSPTVHRVDHGEILELNGPLKHHKRRRKKRVGRKPKAQLPLALDIFEGLSDYEPDRTYDEEDEMEIEVQSVPGVHLKVSQIEEMRRTQPSVQMTVTEPEIQAHKRMRIDEEASGSLLPPMSSLRVPSVSAQELSSDFAARVTPIAGPPRTKFQPEITSTAFKLPIQRLTIQDIEFAQLRQISKEPIQREEQQDVDTIISQMDRKKLMEEQTAAASEVSDTAPSPTTTSPLVKRFEKEGEKIIELRKDNGGYETYAEYDIETMLLYTQIRLMMNASGFWKMKLNDMMPRLRLFRRTKEKIIELRIRLLADAKLLVLTFTEDGEHIDEVEIKINTALSA